MRAFVGALLQVILVCCAVAAPVAAEGRAVSVVGPGAASKLLGPAFDILEDRSERLTIDDVKKSTGFVPVQGTMGHVGFSRSAWWGRFTLHNPGDQPVVQLVDFTSPVVDRLEFYRPAENGAGFRRQVTGDSVIGRSVDMPGLHSIYRVTVPPHQSETYYVRLSGQSILVFDAALHDPDRYADALSGHYDPSLLFFGLVLAAAFYSLAIYVIVRDEAYLLFGLMVVGVSGYFASIWGYMNAFVLPETTWAANFVVASSNCLILFALARFTSFFLRLKKQAPRLEKICIGLQIVSLLILGLCFLDYQLAFIALRFAAVGSIAVSLFLAFVLWCSREEYGRLFAIAWTHFCVFSLFFLLERAGLLPWVSYFETAFRFSFVFISLMFAVLFAGKFRRVTREKERELSMARDEAIAASQAKSRFLAMMSHELRTPLNAVIGFSDILRGEALGKLGNPKYREYAQDIKDAGSHLLAIINDLLEISRIEAGQVELEEGPIMVSELARRCMRIIRERAEMNDLILRVDVSEELPALLGDETRIQQVLINLLYNAVKFTPPGGLVSLDAGLTETGEYRIFVRDTGIGIADEDRARILEPFTQVASYLTRKHDGVGLGLAITKSILDLHGARLDVEGVVGEGTTFAITFPARRVEWKTA